MFLFRRKKSSSTPNSPATHVAVEEIMQRRAREILSTLWEYRPREFEALLSDVENGHIERARLSLRGLEGTVDQGYIEPVLLQLQMEVAASRFSPTEALEDNPDVLRILIRSGNQQEAIELYQKRTGVSWQAALDAIKDLERRLAEEEATSNE